MNQNIEIGKRIKLKREECGLTQEELGKKNKASCYSGNRSSA